MKKKIFMCLLVIVICFLILLFVSRNKYTNEQLPPPSSEELFKENSEELSDITSEELSATESLIDESLLAPFQGEWELVNSDRKLIICNNQVNFISYGYGYFENEVENIYDFYFEIDDSGSLVVANSYSQPRYIMEISEDGQLLCIHISDETDVDSYSKLSDNTVVPEIKDEPRIGMSEKMLLNSKWGYPTKKNTTITASGTTEQWVYDIGYVYLTNGIVTAIQE